MRFRRATESDIPEMSRIRLSVVENVLSNSSVIAAEIQREYLEERGRGWVCEVDGRIVGFSYADRTNDSIWALFVDPAFEGRGIGRELLRLAVEWLFDLGSREVTLSTTAGTRADRFYSAQGWRRESPTEDGDVVFSLIRGAYSSRPDGEAD